ncbi:AI-2E family transporter [Halobaculum sp. MBLA0147]|uniref:AI-2E family transporter n=1 Tax=Halobaculum sp. MBLA0147 TaxID=3079934 RepID=UPI003525BE2A
MVSLDADRSRLAWGVFGAVLALALAFVVYSFVGTVVFGIFLYYATRPVYRRIRRRIGRPTVAAGVSLLALTTPALLLVGYALVVVATELDRLVGQFDAVDPTQIPGVDEETLALLSDPQALASLDWAQYVSTDAVASVLSSATDAVETVAFFGTGLVHLFVMLAIAFYLLRDGDRLRRWLARYTDDRGVVLAYAERVDRDYRNVFFGNILNAALTGAIGVLAYSLLNLFAPGGASIPAAALVGLLAGVASLIPVVGMKLVYVPVAAGMSLRAVATGATPTLWFVAVFVGVSFVVVDTIPDLVLRPYVSGRSLHVGSVMLAYTLGPLLFGWYGIFLLPMLLVLAVQFVRIVLPELIAGRELQPYSVDPGYVDTDPTPDGRTGGVSPSLGEPTGDAEGLGGGEVTDGGDRRGTDEGGDGPEVDDDTLDDGDDTADSGDGSGR